MRISLRSIAAIMAHQGLAPTLADVVGALTISPGP